MLADTAGRVAAGRARSPRTSCYVRLHGDQELYASGYTDAALDEWAERCRRWAAAGLDVFVYFDNDVKGYAPYDAMRPARPARLRLSAFLRLQDLASSSDSG